MHIYARHGVARYWIVDVDKRTLEVYALQGRAHERIATYSGNEMAQIDVPDGLVLALAEIWPED
jgi:Uma2 family endonuclease